MSNLANRMLWHTIDATTDPVRRRRYRKTSVPTALIWTIVVGLIVAWMILK